MTTLSSHALNESGHGEAINRIIDAALQAADPAGAVRRHFLLNDNLLTVDGREYDLAAIRRLLVAGSGKAGAPMASAIHEILGDRVARGVIIVKEGYAQGELSNFQILPAGHPLPDERGVAATQRLIELAQSAETGDLLICPLSGGSSALLTAPVEGLSLAELRQMTSLLLASGATIDEFNTLRKHLDRVKGGQLARLAAPARVLGLILSDVVGDSLETIASGPTAPDPTTYADCWEILERYGCLDQAPVSVKRHLQRGLRGEIPETPKPGDRLFETVQNVIVGSNRMAAEAALEQARREGFDASLLTAALQGEASPVGQQLASKVRQAAQRRPFSSPHCWIAGGETTVTLHGNGLGGRNQELALGAVSGLAGLAGVTLLSLASDGGDGPTDAAGAVVSGQTLARAQSAGLDPAEYLARNDSYHFFETLGDLLITGPTMTNVNDLVIVIMD